MFQFNEDAMRQNLAFVQGQAYAINTRVYETVYPEWDFTELCYVNTQGPEWSPGIMTYSSDMTGKAEWQSAGAKDIPLADVSQDFQTRTHHLASIGYQYNLEEVNAAIQINGTLPDRRARAARKAYMRFMWLLTLWGDTKKGLYGILNNPLVEVIPLPADGTGGVRWWVNSAGVGTKTSAQIARDFNLLLSGIPRDTFDLVYANTIRLPQEAIDYIAGTPYSAMTTETILSFVQRNNVYTLRTGQPIRIRSDRELSTAATDTTSPTSAGSGRAVAYNDSPEYMQLHLPMDHRFLPVWQDGPMNWLVPGIFRTGGVEMMSTAAVRYIDGVSEPRA